MIKHIDDVSVPEVRVLSAEIVVDWGIPVQLPTSGGFPKLDLDSAIPNQLADLRSYIKAQAHALQVSTDMVAPLAIGLAAFAVSRSVEVEPMPEWREPATLWPVVLADSAERKSATLGALSAPIRNWQKDERQRLLEPLATYAERRRGLESQLQGIRTAISKPPKKNDDAGNLSALRRRASELAAELASMPELRAPELVSADATPEACRDLLARNGEKLAIIASEADAGLLMGSRYADGDNMSLFLSGHAGDSCSAHRVGRDIPLDRPALSLLLAVQPAAVVVVLGDSAAIGRGLVPRMLLIRPQSMLGSREMEPSPVPIHLRSWWDTHIRAALDLAWPGRVIVDPCTGNPKRSGIETRILRLDDEAKAALWAFRSDLEPRLCLDGDLAGARAFASKLPGAIVRIALAMEILVNPDADTVQGDIMRAACVWGPWLLAHFLAVTGEASESEQLRHAKRVFAALGRVSARHSEITTRDVLELVKGSAGLETAESVRSAMRMLVDYGWIRPVDQEARRGRPSEAWKLHPDLMSRLEQRDGIRKIRKNYTAPNIANIANIANEFGEEQ